MFGFFKFFFRFSVCYSDSFDHYEILAILWSQWLVIMLKPVKVKKKNRLNPRVNRSNA